MGSNIDLNLIFESIPPEEGFTRFARNGIEIVSQGPVSAHTAVALLLYTTTTTCKGRSCFLITIVADS